MWIMSHHVYKVLAIKQNIDGLVQNCNIAIANTLEILQSCTKTLICWESFSNVFIDKFAFSQQ